MTKLILYLVLCCTIISAEANDLKTPLPPEIPKTIFSGYSGDHASSGPHKMSMEFYKTAAQFMEDLRKSTYIGVDIHLKKNQKNPIDYGNDTFSQTWFITIDKNRFMRVYIGQHTFAST